jgi:23S rRNA (guanosine2251-2'-O)-methyltransferase
MSRKRHLPAGPKRGPIAPKNITGRPADRELIHGRHAVEAALANPRRQLRRLWVTQNARQRLEIPLPGSLPVEIVDPAELDRMVGPDAVHQGLVLEAAPLGTVPLEDLKPEGIVLVLDQITDPHNVGAITRLAAAFKVQAMVMTERHGPGQSAVLAKAASGGLEHVAMVKEPNLARAIEDLKQMGFTVIGLDSEAEITLEDAPASYPLALVLGAEGKGLRRLTRERCDALAKIALPGSIISLNVSTACAIALYVASTHHAPKTGAIAS